MIPICEIFSSFQGEGIKTGLLTAFVRFAGCNLDCRWCDTRYALDTADSIPMERSEILERVRTMRIPNVCITGGEPLVQKESFDLVRDLVDEGFSIHLETNGSIDMKPLGSLTDLIFLSVDVKTPSSGEAGSFMRSNLEIMSNSDQIKFIIMNGRDMKFARDFLTENRPETSIIFTPCFNRNAEMVAGMVKDLLDDCLSSGDTGIESFAERSRFMIQTHRFIWGNRRGV
jgi:7-carboxy-7-deazaguanine synthase